MEEKEIVEVSSSYIESGDLQILYLDQVQIDDFIISDSIPHIESSNKKDLT